MQQIWKKSLNDKRPRTRMLGFLYVLAAQDKQKQCDCMGRPKYELLPGEVQTVPYSICSSRGIGAINEDGSAVEQNL